MAECTVQFAIAVTNHSEVYVPIVRSHGKLRRFTVHSVQ